MCRLLFATLFVVFSCATPENQSSPPSEPKGNTVEADPGLLPADILAVLRKNLTDIHGCYEKLLTREPTANGQMRVQFVVGAQGQVISTSIVDDTITNNADMESCVTSKISKWKFPAPRSEKPVTVTYPFVFNPKPGKGNAPEDAIRIDSQDFRYIGYLRDVRHSIEKTWVYPLDAAKQGKQGTATLIFSILADGSVDKIRVLKSSGHQMLDDAIVEALTIASPFKPLPAKMNKKEMKITASFSYILSPQKPETTPTENTIFRKMGPAKPKD